MPSTGKIDLKALEEYSPQLGSSFDFDGEDFPPPEVTEDKAGPVSEAEVPSSQYINTNGETSAEEFGFFRETLHRRRAHREPKEWPFPQGYHIVNIYGK